MTKTEALQQRSELLKLIEEWTKCEILARHDSLKSPVCWAHREVEIRDKIREIALDTSDLLVLAVRWGMLKPEKNKKG